MSAATLPGSRAFRVIGLGEILWDLFPEGKQLGGAPANFAYHARALGAGAGVVSCVGDDDLGRDAFDRLERAGLQTEHIAVDPDHPTGTVSVSLDAAGVPRYVIHTGVAWDYIPWSDPLRAAAEAADAICFGSLCQRSPVSRETVRRVLSSSRDSCLRVFDINLRQSSYDREVVHESLELSNVLKLNTDELPVVARLLEIEGHQAEVMAELIRRYSLRLVALTRGGGGSVLRTADGCSEHPGCRIEVEDTVGAGDAFTAAVVMGLLHDLDLDTISEAANRLGAYVCTCKGAMPERVPEGILPLQAF